MAETIAELREESTERLREMLVEVKERQLKHNVSVATGEDVKPGDARAMRVEVARIKTILRAMELVAERAGVDEEAARSALASNNGDIVRAVAAAKAAAGRGPPAEGEGSEGGPPGPAEAGGET